jgi:hypothetical protein
MHPGGKLYASTGNIAFVFIRLIHLIGHFNYGRRGILDLTHTRLFTVSSFRRLIRDAGFRIDSIRCFGPPIADLGGADSGLLHFIDRLASSLARAWKGPFGYQILVEATRPDSVDTLMSRTFLDKRSLGSLAAEPERGTAADASPDWGAAKTTTPRSQGLPPLGIQPGCKL